MGDYTGRVIGATVGFLVGGPQGALYGYQLGSAFDPGPTIQGARIGELAAQTSKEGVPRPIIFGISRPIGGNLIATTGPQIVKETESSGGKGSGGGSSDVETEQVYRTYAIRICEGPINGIRRIWRNGKLVYDISSGSFTALANNQQFLNLATLYNGEYDQMPDATLQAAFGVSNVVAHRGTAYMVIDNENLTQLGGAIPQYVFEVMRCEGFFLTSRPYAVEVIDAVDNTPSDITTPYGYTEGVDNTTSISSGSLDSILVEYTDGLAEGIDNATSISSGSLDTLLIEYTDGLAEGVDNSTSISSGSLDVVLADYTEWPTEGVDNTTSISSGTLE